MKFRGFVAAVAATLLVASSASAQSFLVGNDVQTNAWIADNGFTKFFGLQARAGGPNTWETGITQPSNDAPFDGA